MNKTRTLRHNRTNIPKMNVSSQSINILSDSWKKICEYNPVRLPELVDINSEHIKQIQHHNMYAGIPEKIRREFESTSQRGVKIEFILPKGRKAIISVLVPKISTAFWSDYLNRVLLWLHFIDGIASPKCAQTLNVYLLLTDAKKKLPAKDEENIDMIHANTAFTTSCSADNTIFLFRREEWFKVFIHETFHCFGLDFSLLRGGNDSNSRILSLFPAIDPTTDVRLYETYCEMWAEIFNMLFVLFYKPCTHKHTENAICTHRCLPFSTSPFLRILSRECIFSIYQSNKILRRAGYQYGELFTVPSRGKRFYTENTPAFSYYVIKSLMLWNLDLFIKWCVKYSDTNPPIQFPMANISDFCDFVRELTKTDGQYRQNAKTIADNIQMVERTRRKTRTLKSSLYKRTYSCLEKTLRMTSIDIDTDIEK